jgi:hypothetical protein
MRRGTGSRRRSALPARRSMLDRLGGASAGLSRCLCCGPQRPVAMFFRVARGARLVEKTSRPAVATPRLSCVSLRETSHGASAVSGFNVTLGSGVKDDDSACARRRQCATPRPVGHPRHRRSRSVRGGRCMRRASFRALAKTRSGAAHGGEDSGSVRARMSSSRARADPESSPTTRVTPQPQIKPGARTRIASTDPQLARAS